MNNSLVNISLTSTSKLSTTTLARSGNAVNSFFSNSRNWYLGYVQPWLALIGILDNFLVVIIFGPILSGWGVRGCGRRGGRGGGVSLVSRIYYVTISMSEIFNIISGFVIRNAVIYLPLAVSLMSVSALSFLQKLTTISAN